MTHPCVIYMTHVPTKIRPILAHPCAKQDAIVDKRGANRDKIGGIKDGAIMKAMPVVQPPRGTWVQTERAAHEAWATLIDQSPQAAKIMHILTARIEDHNAVVVSQDTLAKLAKASRRTVQRALTVLRDGNWIDIRQIGPNGTVNAYVINDRVAWADRRDNLRLSIFSATVIADAEEQPDRDQLNSLPSLHRLPALFDGEAQLPSGTGLPPISQPFFDGLEPDLPATGRKD